MSERSLVWHLTIVYRKRTVFWDVTRYNLCRNLLCPTSGCFQAWANFYQQTAMIPRLTGVLFRFHACKGETCYVRLAGAKERGSRSLQKVSKLWPDCTVSCSITCAMTAPNLALGTYVVLHFSKHRNNKGYKTKRGCSQKCLIIRYNKVLTRRKYFVHCGK